MEAGAMVPQVHCATADGAGMPPFSWSRVAAEKFLVRQGPNYTKNKAKANSTGSFYELHGVDWYKARQKMDWVGRLAELPEAEFSHPLVPSLLVVNVQLPMEAPQVFKGAKLDGPTLHAVFYFSLKEEAVRALDDLDAAEPSVRLLAEYFRRAEAEPEMRTRFKAIAVVNNQEKLNMARLISPFNGKPVLITESGSLMRGSRKEGSGGGDEGHGGGGGRSSGRSFGVEDYLELDIHVRRWNFMARKGLNKLTPKFDTINVSVAFLVEGRGDEELPEQILGCATLNALDIAKARDMDA